MARVVPSVSRKFFSRTQINARIAPRTVRAPGSIRQNYTTEQVQVDEREAVPHYSSRGGSPQFSADASLEPTKGQYKHYGGHWTTCRLTSVGVAAYFSLYHDYITERPTPLGWPYKEQLSDPEDQRRLQNLPNKLPERSITTQPVVKERCPRKHTNIPSLLDAATHRIYTHSQT